MIALLLHLATFEMSELAYVIAIVVPMGHTDGRGRNVGFQRRIEPIGPVIYYSRFIITRVIPYYPHDEVRGNRS